ncbi:hypothetical protein RHGRI_009726 [Rhododendron griersonianum]|uniref:PGG domain-containing protein n=1 Tax=Rhododendron griersonianum TaxID=479676 RepID=A0AAV6KGH7_9ERIC|nr:hypothetical protein RHGRI_009726 [Rhododendron griersonianum]
MDQKLYKAARKGDVRRLSGIDGRNITEEEAMRIQDGKFLNRTQHGNNNILHIAARAGRDTFVAEALRRFPFLSDQVNSQGDTPLLVAARLGHLQVVKTLAEPNNKLPMQDDDTATAVESGTNSRSIRRQSDVEEGLVDHQLEQGTGQDNVVTVENGTNSSNISRRQRVVEEGLLDDQLEQGTIISELIKQNPDLMRKLDNRGKAAIHHAVEADCWVLLDRMLEADPSIALFPDAEGYTALLIASSRGCWKTCEKIIWFCPESIETRNDKGQHVLHLARSWIPVPLGYFGKIPPEIWELVNVGDDEGNTPLHLAVKENHYVMAILLTSSASIDLGAVNKEGLTALDLCESDWMHINLKRLMWFHLRRHGASRGRHPNVHKVTPGQPRYTMRSRDKDRKPIINTLALIAALIATLTFAAAFTMPGGYDSSSYNLGVATLAKKAALKAFVVSDTLAMCCSILSLFLLLRAMRVEHEVTFSLTNTSMTLLLIAFYATLVAFISGIFAVIAPKALWVAIVVCIICSMGPFFFSPERVQRFSCLTLFMPSILIKDFQRSRQNRARMRNKKREQDYVRSLFERGSPDTTYRVSTTDTIPG